jgi:transposase
MLAITPHRRYYLYREPVNINKSFYRLAAIVRDQMQGNPLTTDVFIFLNRKCTQIKLLSWEGDGFGIYHRRLEKGTFEIPPATEGLNASITYNQLVLILQGISLSKIQYRKRYQQQFMSC